MTSPKNYFGEMEPGGNQRPEREGTVLSESSAAGLDINDLTHVEDFREVVVFDVEALEDDDAAADQGPALEIAVTEDSLIVDLGADQSPEGSVDLAVTTAVASAAAPRAGQLVVVECPQCGLLCEGVDPRPTAAWFCPTCDYPVFLAAPAPPAQVSSEAARRRLPGTDGREMLGAAGCWACGELNPPGMSYCARCGTEQVRPRLEPLVEPEPIIIESPPLIYVARRLPLILVGVAAGALATVAAVLVVIRFG